MKREEEKKKEEEERAQDIPEHVFWTFLSKFAGFNRYYLLSDEWHVANPSAANQLFGFESWEAAKKTAKEIFPTMDMTPPQIYKVQKKRGDLYLELRECSEFEQCFAVKMMDRTGMTSGRAALLYGRDGRTVLRWRQKWAKKWGLPSFSGGDDDGAGKQARVFQSRQMINPVRRKRAAPDEKLPDENDGNKNKKEKNMEDQEGIHRREIQPVALLLPAARHTAAYSVAMNAQQPMNLPLSVTAPIYAPFATAAAQRMDHSYNSSND